MAEASNQLGPRQTRRKPTRRSGVWNHFDEFKDDEGNDKARCKRCQQVLGASTRNGTSTLRAHIRICWGNEAVAAAAAAGHEQEPRVPSQSQTGLQDKNGSGDLARMIALHGYDPSFVEDTYFRSFMRKLNPEFQVPSRVAIEEMCDGICDEARRDLLDRLRRDPDQRFSVALGKTKTLEQAGEVRYIACHFIDDEWKLHKLVLDALVDGSTYGPYEIAPIMGVRVFYDAGDRFHWYGCKYKGRLSVVAYDTTDHYFRPEMRLSLTNPSCATTTYLDNVLNCIAVCLLPDTEFSDDIRGRIMESNLTRQERMQLLSELDLDYEWAYGQPWCACYYSLEVLGRRGNDFGDEELLVKLLRKVWKQVYRGIQKISASTCPTSNLCLAELLKLREILQLELARFSGDGADVQQRFEYFHAHKSLEGALREASNTLDKAIQDSCLVWSVPLALDPRYKLSFIEFSFQRAFGPEAGGEYISQITTKIHNLYVDYIKTYGTITGADHSSSANAATASADPLEQAWNEHCRSQDVIASTQVNGCYTETQTELDRYLQDRRAPAAEDFDLLNWWKLHSSEYPMVARMARDALAMPTCSKLSSDQLAQVRSILRGYSKEPLED